MKARHEKHDARARRKNVSTDRVREFNASSAAQQHDALDQSGVRYATGERDQTKYI